MNKLFKNNKPGAVISTNQNHLNLRSCLKKGNGGTKAKDTRSIHFLQIIELISEDGERIKIDLPEDEEDYDENTNNTTVILIDDLYTPITMDSFASNCKKLAIIQLRREYERSNVTQKEDKLFISFECKDHNFEIHSISIARTFDDGQLMYAIKGRVKDSQSFTFLFEFQEEKDKVEVAQLIASAISHQVKEEQKPNVETSSVNAPIIIDTSTTNTPSNTATKQQSPIKKQQSNLTVRNVKKPANKKVNKRFNTKKNLPEFQTLKRILDVNVLNQEDENEDLDDTVNLKKMQIKRKAEEKFVPSPKLNEEEEDNERSSSSDKPTSNLSQPSQIKEIEHENAKKNNNAISNTPVAKTGPDRGRQNNNTKDNENESTQVNDSDNNIKKIPVNNAKKVGQKSDSPNNNDQNINNKKNNPVNNIKKNPINNAKINNNNQDNNLGNVQKNINKVKANNNTKIKNPNKIKTESEDNNNNLQVNKNNAVNNPLKVKNNQNPVVTNKIANKNANNVNNPNNNANVVNSVNNKINTNNKNKAMNNPNKKVMNKNNANKPIEENDERGEERELETPIINNANNEKINESTVSTNIESLPISTNISPVVIDEPKEIQIEVSMPEKSILSFAPLPSTFSAEIEDIQPVSHLRSSQSKNQNSPNVNSPSLTSLSPTAIASSSQVISPRSSGWSFTPAPTGKNETNFLGMDNPKVERINNPPQSPPRSVKNNDINPPFLSPREKSDSNNGNKAATEVLISPRTVKNNDINPPFLSPREKSESNNGNKVATEVLTSPRTTNESGNDSKWKKIDSFEAVKKLSHKTNEENKESGNVLSHIKSLKSHLLDKKKFNTQFEETPKFSSATMKTTPSTYSSNTVRTPQTPTFTKPSSPPTTAVSNASPVQPKSPVSISSPTPLNNISPQSTSSPDLFSLSNTNPKLPSIRPPPVDKPLPLPPNKMSSQTMRLPQENKPLPLPPPAQNTFSSSNFPSIDKPLPLPPSSQRLTQSGQLPRIDKPLPAPPPIRNSFFPQNPVPPSPQKLTQSGQLPRIDKPLPPPPVNNSNPITKPLPSPFSQTN